MKNLFGLLLSAVMILSFTSCSEDETPAEQGSGDVYITDAPIDNAEVQGVFVTVADIKVDGHSLEGYSKQTINLMAYQNGKTKLLGSSELDVGSYSNIELVLDFAEDANGDAPGCYAETAQGKIDLASSTETSQNINVSGAFDIVSNATSDVVVDFNLRKAIKQNEDNSNQKYSFVAESGLEAATRVVSKGNSGSIEGTYDGTIGSDEKVIVYAYEKGSFDKNSETQANSHGIAFANAKNSGKVNGGTSNSYTLSFLEEGDYELHFARYKENTEGEATFEAMLDVESSSSAAVNDITVEAGANVSMNIKLNGIIGG